MSNRKRTVHRTPLHKILPPHLRTFTAPTPPPARLPPGQARNASGQSPASPLACATNTRSVEPPPEVTCCKRHDACLYQTSHQRAAQSNVEHERQ